MSAPPAGPDPAPGPAAPDEPPAAGPATTPAAAAAPSEAGPTDLEVIAAAAARTPMSWVGTADGATVPLWHVWHDGAVTVVVGEGEQPDRLPAEGERVQVHLRSKDTWSRLVVFTARVEVVPPGTSQWEAATFPLVGGRLNSPDTAAQTERWARTCRVVRLVPEGPLVQGPGRYDDSSGAAVPAPTPATTDTWRPFHVRGRRRARRRPR